MLLSKQPTTSPAYQARVYCGFRPTPHPCDAPSRQDDGYARAPARACIVCVVVHVVAGGRVRWWLFFTAHFACLPSIFLLKNAGDLAHNQTASLLLY